MSISHTPLSLIANGLIIVAFDKKEGRDVANKPSFGSYFGSSFTIDEERDIAESIGLSWEDVNVGHYFIESVNRWALVAPIAKVMK